MTPDKRKPRREGRASDGSREAKREEVPRVILAAASTAMLTDGEARTPGRPRP